jgi:hypothetical protein
MEIAALHTGTFPFTTAVPSLAMTEMPLEIAALHTRTFPFTTAVPSLAQTKNSKRWSHKFLPFFVLHFFPP